MSVYHCSAPFKGCCGNGWLPQLPPFPIPKRRFGSPCWPNPSNLRLPIAAKNFRWEIGKKRKKLILVVVKSRTFTAFLNSILSLRTLKLWKFTSKIARLFQSPKPALSTTSSYAYFHQRLCIHYLQFCIFPPTISLIIFFFIFHPNPIGKFSILAFSNSSFPICLRWFFSFLRYFFH